MEKILLIIITRMYAERRSPDDEFVHYWNQDCNEDCRLFQKDHCDILLFHGHREINNYNEAITNTIANKNLQLGRYKKTIILYHPQSGVQFNPDQNNLGKAECRQYSIGSSSNQLGNIINNLNLLENAKKEILGLIPEIKNSKLAIIKHTINKRLGAMDIELQKIKELAKEGKYELFITAIHIFREKYKGTNLDILWDEIKNVTYIDEKIKNNLDKLLSENKGINEELNKLLSGKTEDSEKLFMEYKDNKDMPKLCWWLREMDKILEP